MFDLNGDRKHDWQDDAIYHEVISPKDGKKSANSSGYAQSGGFWRSPLSTYIPLLYLAAFIPGDISINGFTSLIGLVCAGILGLKFLAWAYS